MKTVAIIQARMSSTRLPGKVMKTLCGRTVLSHVIGRVKVCALIDEVVVATSTLAADDVIVSEAESCGASSFRGSEDDVLDRYYRAAAEHNAATVVRITSDCPLIDPALLCDMVDRFNGVLRSGGDVDYLSNTLTRSYPRGLDVEVFSFGALEKSHKEATMPHEREHVTPYMHQHPDIFKLREVLSEKDNSGYRLTLDTPEDFRLIEEIYKVLYREGAIFGTDEVLNLLRARPELPLINAHVEQKKL